MALAATSASVLSSVRFNREHNGNNNALRLSAVQLRHVRVHAQARLSFLQSDAVGTCKYTAEIETAVHIVENGCHAFKRAKKTLFSSQSSTVSQKIADVERFVRVYVAFQKRMREDLSKLFPKIPIVHEEDLTRFGLPLLENFVGESFSEAAEDEDDDYFYSPLKDLHIRAVVYPPGSHTTHWVIGPIDGAEGFLRGGTSLYVIGLALIVDGIPVLGVMGCPNWKTGSVIGNAERSGDSGSGVIMASCLGHGTWIRRRSSLKIPSLEKNDDQWARCHVDNCQSIMEAKYCIQDGSTLELYPLSGTLRVINGWKPNIVSSCYGMLCKYMMVASGKASAILANEPGGSPAKIWDHAAGMVCVSEAGGKVTGWDGGSLELAHDAIEIATSYVKGDGVRVTNGALHSQILDIAKN